MKNLLLSSSVKDTFQSAIRLAEELNLGMELSRLPYYGNPQFSASEMADVISTEVRFFHNRLTVHALFSDLNPGTNDRDILNIVDERYKYSFQIAKKIGADTVLFHSGNKCMKHYGSQKKYINNASKYWRDFIKYFEDNNIVAVIENVHERTPDFCLQLIEAVNSPNFKLALDVGHANLFSDVPVVDWINAYGDNLVHMHIHNNFGLNDDHFSLTNGNIDYIEIFETLKKLNLNPSIVFEMFQEEHLRESIKFFNDCCRKLS